MMKGILSIGLAASAVTMAACGGGEADEPTPTACFERPVVFKTGQRAFLQDCSKNLQPGDYMFVWFTDYDAQGRNRGTVFGRPPFGEHGEIPPTVVPSSVAVKEEVKYCVMRDIAGKPTEVHCDIETFPVEYVPYKG